MTHVSNFSPQASAFEADAQQSCPECQGAVLRIWRRPVDRLSAFLMPTRRYRCQSFQCQWEGNLRQNRRVLPAGAFAQDRAGDPPGLSRIFLLSMAFAFATATFIVVATATNWLEPGGLLVSMRDLPFNPSTSTST